MGSSLADFACWLKALCGPILWAMGLNNYCGLGFHTIKSWYSQLKTQLLFFFLGRKKSSMVVLFVCWEISKNYIIYIRWNRLHLKKKKKFLLFKLRHVQLHNEPYCGGENLRNMRLSQNSIKWFIEYLLCSFKPINPPKIQSPHRLYSFTTPWSMHDIFS